MAKPGSTVLNFPMSFTGVLTVLMILVLAHVFEHGARLRSDLEGTV
jgi:hypothetical protein